MVSVTSYSRRLPSDSMTELFTIPGALGRGSVRRSQQRCSPLCLATSSGPACWWSEWCHRFETSDPPLCMGWGHPWWGRSQTGPSCTSVDQEHIWRIPFLEKIELMNICRMYLVFVTGYYWWPADLTNVLSHHLGQLWKQSLVSMYLLLLNVNFFVSFS